MKKYSLLILSLLAGLQLWAQGLEFDKNWKKVGRGDADVQPSQVVLKDCWLVNQDELPTNNFEYRFSAKGAKNSEQVQIWAGWAFENRDKRYAFGLRGGNNNDLYFVHYEPIGKDKPLSWASLDFQPQVDEWYDVRIVCCDGQIGIYLADEDCPRLFFEDKHFMDGGHFFVGGGWLPTVFKDVSVRQLTKAEIEAFAKNTTVYAAAPSVDKEKVRSKQRGKYRSVRVQKVAKGRTEVDLSGNWLFMPEQDVERVEDAVSAEVSDKDWHIMTVPQFWNPVRNWLHGQDSGLPHWGSGISDNYREKEDARCDGYTFDSRKTTSAWYRNWLELPRTIVNKQVSLQFEAVSKVAEVYVNGEYAGGHVGMFGQFDVDVTKLIKPGKNLIAVNVKVRKFERSADADKNVARAVSVDINNDMLNSLPAGMFKGTEGGIWQPVKLLITNDLKIDDVFIQPSLDGGKFNITLKNSGLEQQKAMAKIEIRSEATGKLLYKSAAATAIDVAPNATQTQTISVSNLSPKLWTPETPNLYVCKVTIEQANGVVDQTKHTFGFRTIEAVGNKFMLNGIAYWMRGANHPPCGIAANDQKLANKFMKLMHDGNQMVTRSHGSPFTSVWMNAADKQGVGVSYEGSWPWMMIGSIPSEELLDVWKEETLSLVKKYRNHPSLLVWTMNNEMYFTMFYHNDPRDVRIRKWKYLSDVIKEVRKLVPGLPICADSGYDRLKMDYEKVLAPNGIDDGDVDDRHVYFNWYNRDFFQIMSGEWDDRIYWTPGANKDRPFFAQEVSTGYLNNDEGHFCRKYIFKHYVPHAYVGDMAWEDRDPKYGMQRHAFMTKELAEVIRRTAPETAGILLFANVSWYRDVYSAQKIEPWPVAAELKKAYEPILVSAELTGRQFWAGTEVERNIYVVNNGLDGKKLSNLRLEWSFSVGNNILSKGNVDFKDVAHYASEKEAVKLKLPTNLPNDKNNCKLEFKLISGAKTLSTNSYDLLIAKADWLKEVAKLKTKKIGLYDQTGETKAVFDALKIPYFVLNDLTEIRFKEMDILVAANVDSDNEVPYSWEDVRRVAGNGQNVLLIHPGKHLRWLMFDRVEGTWERPGRVLNMKKPEHKAFDDIDLMELSWWQPKSGLRPAACKRTYRFYPKAMKDITNLATYLRPHVYIGNPKEQLPEMSGVALAEIKEKAGTIVASELELNQATADPIAARVLVNLLLYLSK